MAIAKAVLPFFDYAARRKCVAVVRCHAPRKIPPLEDGCGGSQIRTAEGASRSSGQHRRDRRLPGRSPAPPWRHDPCEARWKPCLVRQTTTRLHSRHGDERAGDGEGFEALCQQRRLRTRPVHRRCHGRQSTASNIPRRLSGPGTTPKLRIHAPGTLTYIEREADTQRWR
jgi:hypothetical protein